MILEFWIEVFYECLLHQTLADRANSVLVFFTPAHVVSELFEQGLLTQKALNQDAYINQIKNDWVCLANPFWTKG